MKDPGIPLDARSRILVIGLGRSGRASIDVLLGRGATLYAVDESPQVLADFEATLAAGKPVRAVSPADLPRILSELSLAVLSPGVPMTSPVVRRVQDARIPVFSEIEVAYRISKAPIVAVTGTKGKSTTTALLGALFRAAGRTTFVGGNIGNPLIAETAVAPEDSWVIAEVSSFQLEAIRSFKPRVATILNVTPDHLDRYFSMDEYTEAKFRVFANQNERDTFVGNLDDPITAELATDENKSRLHGTTRWFSRKGHKRASVYLRNGNITWAPSIGDPRPIDVLPVSDIHLIGDHNVENVLAATAVALAAGIEPHHIRAGVQSFESMPHRLQPVGEVNGVRFVDDSKATNPGSVIAAIEAIDAPIILIAGGKSKGTSFTALGKAIDKNVRAVVLIGEAAPEIAKAIEQVTYVRAESMDDAVACAAVLAEHGDVVLLSPGCASFDMFASAEARGDEFATAVRARMRALR